MDPVILFFILGAIGGLTKSDLRVPQQFYQTLSIYLLLSIGIKGGLELSHSNLGQVVLPGIGTVILGVGITLLAFVLLKKVWKFKEKNAIALATHYGSVSAVTFVVVLSFLENKEVFYEDFMTVILVLLEVPAIIVGVTMAGVLDPSRTYRKRVVFREVFVSKTILLLLGGMVIGSYIGYSGHEELNSFFIDLFKGFLAIFMLEMGIVASERLAELKAVGLRLITFALIMPLISATLGILVGKATGLSLGGSLVLCTLAASASYIAAPAAMRLAIPSANPSLYLTASLGITFPFNIVIGIPIYYQFAKLFY